MILTGVDVPIASMRNAFASLLWPDVEKKIYYSRVFRNLNKQGNIIGEVFLKDKEYKEVQFNDKYFVNSFFDVGEEVIDSDPDLQATREVGIIFSVRLDKIYPDLEYRAVEEVYRDVLTVINDTHSLQVTPNNIIAGLNAYGDLSTDRLKAYNMQPWHVFRVNTIMKVNYDCGVTYTPTTGITAYEYPFPIIFTD